MDQECADNPAHSKEHLTPTSPRNIETPTGPKVGSIFGRMEILGISSFLTQTGNQPNEHRQWEEKQDIPVPVGTLAIVASQDYWLLAYGDMSEIFDPLDINANPTWNPSDHNWGLGRASIGVLDINAPDFTVNPPTQSAEISVKMNLLDENGDDSWFGLLGYTLTFLGLAQRSTTGASTVSPAARERRINWHGGKGG